MHIVEEDGIFLWGKDDGTGQGHVCPISGITVNNFDDFLPPWLGRRDRLCGCIKWRSELTKGSDWSMFHWGVGSPITRND